MNHDDGLITRSLEQLARHAPTFEGYRAPRTRSRSSRLLAPLLASAGVVAVLVGGTVLLSSERGGQPPLDPGTSGSPRGPSSPTAMEPPLHLAAVTTWLHERPASCAAWTPQDRDSVVSLAVLDDSCVVKASRSAVTVFLAPYRSSVLFGSKWAEVTQPWRVIDGHPVRRLSSGPLLELSSRVADAIVCQECDQAVVVLGLHPGEVRSVVESVRPAN